MKIVAKPIEVLAVFSATGEIRPYRFRISSDPHMQTIRVDRIVHVEEKKVAGISAIHFDCRSQMDEREIMYQLRYQTEDQRWILFKI